MFNFGLSILAICICDNAWFIYLFYSALAIKYIYYWAKYSNDYFEPSVISAICATHGCLNRLSD